MGCYWGTCKDTAPHFEGWHNRRQTTTGVDQRSELRDSWTHPCTPSSEKKYNNSDLTHNYIWSTIFLDTQRGRGVDMFWFSVNMNLFLQFICTDSSWQISSYQTLIFYAFENLFKIFLKIKFKKDFWTNHFSLFLIYIGIKLNSISYLQT